MDTDLQHDEILSNAITGISQRCELECNRKFGRTVGAVHEFQADEVELAVAHYPIESITRFEVKPDEPTGWVEMSEAVPLIRRGCVIRLDTALGRSIEQARVIYTGGYVLPGAVPGAGQTALPEVLKMAATEQVAFWFQTRDLLGVLKSWPSGGNYQQFESVDLLPSVKAVLGKFRSWGL